MKIYTNENGEIKDVNSTSDPSLIEYDLIDATNPFLGWSVAKICCYKVTVFNGIVTMMTPYVPSDTIESIDTVGKQVDGITPFVATATLQAGDDKEVFLDVPDGIVSVLVNDPEKQNIPYHVTRNDDRVTVWFESALSYVVDITIKVN
jgi:hypothetical protein